MKLTFRGWQREVTTHSHSVTPVVYAKNKYASTTGTALVWNDALSAYGKVQKLALSGSFLVEFKFEASELKSWLAQYVKANPEEAIRMLGEMEAEAVIELTKRQAATVS